VVKCSKIFEAQKVKLTIPRRVAIEFQFVTLFEEMASTSKTYS